MKYARYPRTGRLVRYLGLRETVRLKRVLRMEMVGGVLVMAAAALGFVLANTPLNEWYFALREYRIGPESLGLHLTLGQWSADGLLAVFFFLVGLELKREFVEGALSRFSTAIVPIVAAAGGVVVPALIYVAVNAGEQSVRGWAIPTATDIAFAVAVLGLIAPGVPLALRVFLLTLAVVDDFIAIAIIAVAYTDTIHLLPLVAALALIGIYAVFARTFVGWYFTKPWAAWATLLPIAIVAWALVHASGVHATIAGVLLAFAVPVRATPRNGARRRAAPTVKLTPQPTSQPLAERFGYRFGPISTGFAVPVFAFFAAGVAVGGESRFPADPIAIGIMLGLVLGKPVGIVLTTVALTRFTRAQIDSSVKLRELIGVGALAGIGFTVALLIAELSFVDAADADTARLAVMAASVVAALVATVLLAGSRRKRGA